MYRLKDDVESFKVVDGPYANKKFLKGKDYAEVPPGEAHKFEEVENVRPSSAKAMEGGRRKKGPEK